MTKHTYTSVWKDRTSWSKEWDEIGDEECSLHPEGDLESIYFPSYHCLSTFQLLASRVTATSPPTQGMALEKF